LKRHFRVFGFTGDVGGFAILAGRRDVEGFAILAGRRDAGDGFDLPQGAERLGLRLGTCSNSFR
jgi:hypothetical protein